MKLKEKTKLHNVGLQADVKRPYKSFINANRLCEEIYLKLLDEFPVLEKLKVNIYPFAYSGSDHKPEGIGFMVDRYFVAPIDDYRDILNVKSTDEFDDIQEQYQEFRDIAKKAVENYNNTIFA